MAEVVALLAIEPATVSEPRFGPLTAAQVVYFSIGGTAWLAYAMKTPTCQLMSPRSARLSTR